MSVGRYPACLGNTEFPRQCKHLYTGFLRDDESETLVRTCAAFPAGIPVSIWGGMLPHNVSVRGDDGIMYEPSED